MATNNIFATQQPANLQNMIRGSSMVQPTALPPARTLPSPYPTAQPPMGGGFSALPGTQQPAAVQAPNDAYGGGGGGAYSGGMTMTSGGAAPVSSAGLNTYSQNPYLKQMGVDLQNQFTNTLLRDTLPGVRGGALAAGGVGGSRQGIAEGLATAGSNTGAASAVTNLYGQDYENQMRRNLQQYQADQQFALGNANIALGYSGQANQYDLGRRGIDLGYTNANNSFNLGMGNLALGNKSADNQYGLGLGNLALGNKSADNNYDLGLGNLDLGRTNSARTYDLGQGNLALGNKNSDQSYNLGMGQQALTGQGQALNFYSDQRNQDRNDLTTAAALYNQGIQGEWSPINQANGVYGPYTGFGTQTSNQSSGGGWGGALGGAIGGATLGRNMGWW